MTEVTIQNHVLGLWTTTFIKTITECLNLDLANIGFEHKLCQAVIINVTKKVMLSANQYTITWRNKMKI